MLRALVADADVRWRRAARGGGQPLARANAARSASSDSVQRIATRASDGSTPARNGAIGLRLVAAWPMSAAASSNVQLRRLSPDARPWTPRRSEAR